MASLCKIVLPICFVALLSCEDDKPGKPENYIVTTDKSVYLSQENVAVTIHNNTGMDLQYSVCSGYPGAPFLLQRLDGINWVPVYAPICNGLMSYCCHTIRQNEILEEIIPGQYFSPGTYRIEYTFTINNKRKEYQSKKFEVR